MVGTNAAFILLGLAVACAHVTKSVAESYPSRPIRLIVPQAPGGTADAAARAIAPGLSKVLGQQVVIDNRGGAGGIIGTEMVARAIPDGYTISYNSGGPLSIIPHLQKVSYNPVRDFQPVSLTTISPFALVVHPSLPARNIADLISLAKAAPGKLSYAAGNGSVVFLGMELLKNMAGVNILHVPYTSTAQGLTDVLGKNVTLTLFAIPVIVQYAKTERLRVLAVTGAKRSSYLKDTPTIAEAGFSGYEIAVWTGMLVPLKTPPQIVTALNNALIKVLRASDMKSQFEALGLELVGSTPNEFLTFINIELDKNGKILSNSRQ